MERRLAIDELELHFEEHWIVETTSNKASARRTIKNSAEAVFQQALSLPVAV